MAWRAVDRQVDRDTGLRDHFEFVAGRCLFVDRRDPVDPLHCATGERSPSDSTATASVTHGGITDDATDTTDDPCDHRTVDTSGNLMERGPGGDQHRRADEPRRLRT